MVEKTEASFKKLLKDLDDSQIKQYYKDLEWTAFPVLIIKEYQKRFNAKNTQQVVNKLKVQTELAKQKSLVIKKLATQKGTQIGASLIKQASNTVSQGVSSAKRMTYSPEQSIVILEKLAALNKKGIISNKEFAAKKKDILKKI